MVLGVWRAVLVYRIATRDGVAPVTTLLLAGIAVGAFLTALSSLLLSLQHRDLAGGAGHRVLDDGRARLADVGARLAVGAHSSAIGSVAALLQSRTLDLLLLGEETRGGARRGRRGCQATASLVTSALLTGAAVAAAGLVGFVGLDRAARGASVAGASDIGRCCRRARSPVRVSRRVRSGRAHGEAAGGDSARRGDGLVRRAVLSVSVAAATQGGAALNGSLERRHVVERDGRALLLDARHGAIAPGALTAIVGPNGSGKSTLLRALAGLWPPSEGTVTLDGVALARHAAKARSPGASPFSRRTHVAISRLPLSEMVAMGRHPHRGAHRTSAIVDDAAVDAASRTCGLRHLRAATVDRLSGGERQRVAIARCLASEPRILLLGRADCAPRPAARAGYCRAGEDHGRGRTRGRDRHARR